MLLTLVSIRNRSNLVQRSFTWTLSFFTFSFASRIGFSASLRASWKVMCLRYPSEYLYSGRLGCGGGGGLLDRNAENGSGGGGFFFFFFLRVLGGVVEFKSSDGVSPVERRDVSAGRSGGEESQSRSCRSSALKGREDEFEFEVVGWGWGLVVGFFFFLGLSLGRVLDGYVVEVEEEVALEEAFLLLFFRISRLGIAADGIIGGEAAKLWNSRELKMVFDMTCLLGKVQAMG